MFLLSKKDSKYPAYRCRVSYDGPTPSLLYRILKHLRKGMGGEDSVMRKRRDVRSNGDTHREMVEFQIILLALLGVVL